MDLGVLLVQLPIQAEQDANPRILIQSATDQNHFFSTLDTLGEVLTFWIWF